MNIQLSALIEALQAIKKAEAYVDEQPGQGALWCDLMQSRVLLEMYVNRALEGQTVTIEQDIEGSPV